MSYHGYDPDLVDADMRAMGGEIEKLEIRNDLLQRQREYWKDMAWTCRDALEGILAQTNLPQSVEFPPEPKE